MTTIWRIFIYSWKNLARNAWIGLATVFVFMMALLSVNVLLGVNVMLDRVVHILEEKVDATVAFKAGTPDAVLSQARFYLTSLPQVSSVQFVTADEALKDFRARHADNPKVLSALDELSGNPLGAQIVVKAKHPEDYPFLMSAVQNPQYATFIESQTYDDHKVAIERIQSIGRNMRIFGAILVALFALFGLLIAFNAIRVAIYTQREEIGIMRLVGASSFFIRAPFVLEGVWLASLALLVSGLAIAGTIAWIEPIMRPLFDGSDPGLVTFFTHHFFTIVFIEGGSMLLMVGVVSWMAIGKYFRGK